MYPNLKAEMARYDVKNKDIAEVLGISNSTVGEKLNREDGFSLQQAQKIRDGFFKGFDIEYLFSNKICLIYQVDANNEGKYVEWRERG